MARATRSRGAVAKPITKKPVKKSAPSKTTKSVHNAFHDISNQNERYGEGVFIEAKEEETYITGSEEEAEMSEESDDSDYEEDQKSKGRSRTAPKKATKKTAIKKMTTKIHSKSVSRKKNEINKTTKSKSDSKTKVSQDVLYSKPALDDRDSFSAVRGLRIPPEQSDAGKEEDIGGEDWRCIEAIDY